MRFILNGAAMELTAEQVSRALRNVTPEPVRQHGVRVGGTVYPVKQASEQATGVSRREFTSQTARRLLGNLGLEIVGAGSSGTSPAPTTAPAASPPVAEATAAPRAWPWEGEVQTLFGAFLNQAGWVVTTLADTATKAQGVDVLARKEQRLLGAEVKGWPSRGTPTRGEPRRPS